MQISAAWSDLKSFVIARNLSIQWIFLNNTYILWAIDGPVEMTTQISYTDPPLSDQLDFETNYKAAGNQTVKTKVVQQLGLDSVSIQPFGVLFPAAANSTTTYDYKLLDNYSLKGGVLFAKDASVGDSISVQVVDVDNIVGYGAGAVLTTYITNWYVIPNEQNVVEDISISAPISAGLYFRFVYASTSASTDAKVIVNFMAYKVNS